ncbi:MAG: hypothetical protein U9N59_00140 [Campylobacterota bacterium]|nr:hypothetical protein [Campylobacterota bacterium]
MKVLFILGFITAVIVLIAIVIWINNYSEREYNYEFFNWGNYVATAIGYFLIWYGDSWFNEAVINNGDLLNGQLLIGIGLVFLVSVLYIHIKNTNFLFGVVIGAFQFIVYLPLAIFGFIGLLMAVAWLMDTKPVYRI